MSVLKYFPPILDRTTLCIISVSCAWCAVVIYLHEHHYDLEWDTGYAIGILSGALAFLLPMRLGAATTKHQQGISLYNALCGDVLAMGWHVLSETPQAATDSDWKDILRIASVIPGAVKHHFRGDLDTGQLKDYEGELYKDTKPGLKTFRLNSGGAYVEALLFTLMDNLQDYAYTHPDSMDYRVLVSKWEAVYGSWGSLCSMFSYRPPSAITYIRNTVLLMYCVFLPFSMYGDGYWSVLHVFIILYFFIGLNLSVSAAGMPFSESRKSSYMTVTGTETATRNGIRHLAVNTTARAIFDDQKPSAVVSTNVNF